MTIVEILDGLAELGRLRLERERAEQQAAQAQSGSTPTMNSMQQVVNTASGDAPGPV